MHESVALTSSSKPQLTARQKIYACIKEYPASSEETERSLGLFIRASLLARFFAVQEIYQKIVNIPGSIIDFGTWRGQTAILCENMRAIYEPLNFQRRIHAFDTFSGYKGFSEMEKNVLPFLMMALIQLVMIMLNI